MECPNCKNEIEYSWSVYLKHPLGRFVCAACNAKYKHVRPWYYWLIAVIYLVFVFVGGGVFLSVFDFFTKSGFLLLAGYLSWLILISVLWCSLDRKFESKLPTKLR